MKKEIKGSRRGLTFSLSENDSQIGSKYNYIVDVQKGEVVITPDINGKSTVSRKRCGKSYKPLYDIRSKEVRELCQKSEYMQVEVLSDKIVVHTFKKRKFRGLRSNIVNIEELIGRKTGEIVICKAAGSEWDFGRPTLANDLYFESLCNSVPKHMRKGFTKEKKQELRTVYDVVSLFSGAGLLDYSFKDPRFRFVYAVDFDEDACATYKENIGNHIACKDIRDVSSEEVPACDLIIGGPCCQGYSNSNRRNIDTQEGRDKRLLIEDYVRITQEKRPKVFVIENVPQFYTKEDGLYLNKVLEGLSDYEITCNIVVDYEVGGYTKRKRAILIGSRIGKIELPDAEFTTIHTVRDALSKVDATWFNYGDVNAPKKETELSMSYVPQGGNWESIPEEVHKFGKDTHSDRFRRLAWDETAPTIVNWRKICMMPPEGNRILSVAEAAALMGLDKDFKILGRTLGSKQQQIGNGVTQAIGKFVKEHVLHALDANDEREKTILCI